MKFLDLPIEITLQLVLSLDDPDLLTFTALSRDLRTLTTSDIRVRYRLECYAARVVDNPNTRRPIHECLDLLKRRENAWRSLTIRRKSTVPIEHISTGIYDLTGGVYFIGERLHSGFFSALTKKLRWLRLPSAENPVDAKVQWNTLDIEKPISDLGVALDEHDLVVLAYFDVNHVPGDPTRATMSLHARIIQLSTGHNHPLASQPDLFVHQYSIVVAPPALSIEIVGDKLVLLLSFPFAAQGRSEPVRLFVWNWKTGQLHYKMSAPDATYQSFFFLTSNVIVIPNLTDPSLELFDISFTNGPKEEAGAPQCIRTLLLPTLAPDATLLRLACRGEPNPTASTLISTVQEPFLNVAEDALVVFNILVQNPTIGRFGRIINLTLIVHRNAIAQWIPGRNADIDRPNRVPYAKWGPFVSRWFMADDSSTRWITTTCGQRFVSVPRQDGGQIILRDFNQFTVKKILALTPQRNNPRAPLDDILMRLIEREEVVLRRTATVDNNEEDVQHELDAVGAHFDLEENIDVAIQTSEQDSDVDGFIFLSSGSPSSIIIGEEAVLEGGKKVRVVTKPTVLLKVFGAFSEDVKSTLPYVETISSDRFDYEAVLMDEKRILGLKLDENEERTVAIDILNFD